jgi:putative inorganic carbon (HCO3(-)) transporter
VRWLVVEWLALGLATPIFWFPQRLPLLTGLALLVIPVSWLARLRAGRLGRRSGVELPLVGLLLATCLASVPVFDASLAAPKLLGVALGAAVLLLVVNSVNSAPALERAVRLLGLLTWALAGVGLLATDWTTGKLPGLQPVLARVPGVLRGIVPNTGGAGLNPNELAGVLTLVLPVLAIWTAVSWRGHRRGQAALLGGAALVGGGLMVASQSRGAITGIGVALLLSLGLWLRRLPRPGRGLVAAYLALVALGVWLAIRISLAWIAGADRSTDALDSFSARVEIWRAAVAMLRDFPLTGIGLGQFSPVLHLYYPSPLIADQQFVPHAHDLYLAYLTELGLPGALAWAVLVGVVLRAALRGRRAAVPGVRWMATGLLLGVAGFLVFGLVDAVAPGARGGLVLWTVLGLGVAAGRLQTA